MGDHPRHGDAPRSRAGSTAMRPTTLAAPPSPTRRGALRGRRARRWRMLPLGGQAVAGGTHSTARPGDAGGYVGGEPLPRAPAAEVAGAGRDRP
eukprot:3953991-Prymnesium_polylepis.2